jgi:hypothetical protein
LKEPLHELDSQYDRFAGRRSQRIQYVIDCTDRNSALSFVKAAKGTIEAGVVHAACSMERMTQVAEHQLRFLLDSSPPSN